jgi:putative pyoverdin transport system ATP-binding/permease protein
VEINFKQLLSMLGFLWSQSPRVARWILLPLALLAGLSRNWVMVIVNKAAAAPIDETLQVWLPLFVAAFIVVLVSAFAYQLLGAMVTTRVINDVRLKMIGNLLKTQPSFIDKHQHGAIYHILTTDVGAVANFSTTFLNLLPSIVFLIIAVPQMFFYSTMAGFFALLVMIGGTLSYYFQQKVLAKLNTDARLLDVAYFEKVTELLWGIRELRLNMPRRLSFMRALDEVLVKLRSVLIAVTRIHESGEIVIGALKYALFGGIVFLVPYLVKTEATVTFQLITFVLFALIPFEQIISSYLSVIATLVSYVRIKDLNAQLRPYEVIGETIPAKSPPFREINLDGVTAVHGSREKSGFILGPINCKIRRSEIIFLIGHNGSGKTTFMNVLAGLFDNVEGRISLDGKTMDAEDMAAYRSRISAVFTVYHVFRELYGLEHVTGEAADDMIERVRLKGVTALASGKVSRVNLSAGQKRRLALAIALLEDRELLILDEFVADQDPTQREYFFRELLPWLKSRGKTIVVSTHDLQWLDCCDRVFRFEAGKMIELDESSGKPHVAAQAASDKGASSNPGVH